MLKKTSNSQHACTRVDSYKNENIAAFKTTTDSLYYRLIMREFPPRSKACISYC